jgi:hypothetical protein
LEVVKASELLPTGVEVHLVAPVEEHVHRPPEEAAASLPQLQLAGSLPATNSANLSGSLWTPSGSPLRTTMNSNSTHPRKTTTLQETTTIQALLLQHGRDLGLDLY